MRKTYFNWSSGKDSSMALLAAQQKSDLTIEKLVTTINSENDRVTMHGLPKRLLELQATSIGIPLHLIEIPGKVSMETYGDIMTKATDQLLSEGFTDCVFGDIFLEDLRKYREDKLKDFKCHFPLWKKDTTELIQRFIENGFKAITVSIDNQKLDESFLGCVIDKDFIKRLPKGVDPCGENGEFHTFCFDGPIFKEPVKFKSGEKVFKEYEHDGQTFGFWFLDLIAYE